MIYRAARPFLFRLEAEPAHELAIKVLTFVEARRTFLNMVSVLARPVEAPRNLWNLRFRNAIGVAAGFDKNGVVVEALQALGFGFLEIGTVTPQPQSGNPKPRMFRLPQQQALINRLGFNNDGADAVRRRLDALRTKGTIHVPLFINIGKNRDVPLEGAASDYAQCYEALAPFADVVVVNISSPNTPGLRDLQTVEHLRRLFGELRESRAKLGLESRPIALKISPDLEEAELEELVVAARELADGIIATNTTTDRSALPATAPTNGGVSGRPLFNRSTAILRRTRAIVGAGYPLIGVGGIMSAEDVKVKMDAGADLVQVYTGFVYEGPFMVRSWMKQLAK